MAQSGSRRPPRDPAAVPSSARIYDFLLGGANNFAIDRQAAQHIVAVQPDMPFIARANRAFLRRAVTFLATLGIDQYLDLGSGIPTVGNVHEVAQRVNPDARVVYVDLDPVTVAHAEALLRGNPLVAAIQGDLRQPHEMLAHATVQRLLDLRRPTAVLSLAALHFVLDDAEAERIIAEFCAALAPGSYLVVTHAAYDYLPPEGQRKMEQLSVAAGIPLRVRDRAVLARYFESLELVEPGLVYLPQWHPESASDLFMDDPPRCGVYCGVGRKP